MSWIKVPLKKILHDGLIYKTTLNDRGMFLTLLLLAQRDSDTGFIGVSEHIGYSARQLGLMLGTTSKKASVAINRLAGFDLIKVEKTGVIRINDWKAYRSEYLRQKQYKKKSKKKVIMEAAPPITDEVKAFVDKAIEKFDKIPVPPSTDGRDLELIKQTEEPYNLDEHGKNDEPEEKYIPKPPINAGEFIRHFCAAYKKRHGETPVISKAEMEAAKQIVSKGKINGVSRMIKDFIGHGDVSNHKIQYLAPFIDKARRSNG